MKIWGAFAYCSVASKEEDKLDFFALHNTWQFVCAKLQTYYDIYPSYLPAGCYLIKYCPCGVSANWLTLSLNRKCCENCIASSKRTICAEIKQNAFGKKRDKIWINHTKNALGGNGLLFSKALRFSLSHFILLNANCFKVTEIYYYQQLEKNWSAYMRQRCIAEVLYIFGPQSSISLK